MNEQATAPEDKEPKGPDVQYGEIFKYAKPSCKTCFGKGQFQVTIQMARGRKLLPITGKEKDTTGRVCGCARRQFMKRFGDQVAWSSKGALAWKEPKTEAVAP